MALLYKRVAFADSPLSLTTPNLDVVNANQNSLILDVDISGGDIVVNLPSLTSLLYGSGAKLNGSGALTNGAGVGGGALSFYINGNIVAEGSGVNNKLTINPYRVNTVSEVDQDVICGQTSATVGGSGHDLGTCFNLFIAGRHSWGILQCINHGS